MAVIENIHFRVTGMSNRSETAESDSEGTYLLLTCQGTYGLKRIFFELFSFKVLSRSNVNYDNWVKLKS